MALAENEKWCQNLFIVQWLYKICIVTVQNLYSVQNFMRNYWWAPQEIEKHILKQLVKKHLKMYSSREVNDMNKKLQCSDYQSIATYIYAKFHQKISNGSEGIDEHTPEWAPDKKKIV